MNLEIETNYYQFCDMTSCVFLVFKNFKKEKAWLVIKRLFIAAMMISDT